MAVARAVSVEVSTVLYQTDAPEIVLCRDRVGSTYLCCLVALLHEGMRYLAVQISGERLADLRSGVIDLRAALVGPEMALHYEGLSSDSASPSIVLTPLEAPPPESWLPDDGFMLNDVEAEADDIAISKDSLVKNAAVIVYTIDPPEARGTTARVDADRLAAYVRNFQELVKRAGDRAKTRLNAAARKALPDDAFTLRVFAVSPGSFKVHFEASDAANLYGASATGEAMIEIDRLMQSAHLPPAEAIAVLAESKGHVLGAYYELMRLVAKQNVPFSYRWSDPGLPTSQGFGVSVAEARAIVAILETQDTLKSVPFSFYGRFTSVKTEPPPFSWIARDDDGKKRQGFLHEDHTNALDGVRIKASRYLLLGEERLLASPKGEPALKLFLVSAEPQDSTPSDVQQIGDR